MKPLTAEEAIEPLYNFLQMAFTGEHDPSKIPLEKSGAEKLLRRISDGNPIPIKLAMEMPAGERRALHELLTQYVMFLTMFRDLNFPPSFLSGTDETCIGASWLSYIAEHQWPFPQQLPWLRNA